MQVVETLKKSLENATLEQLVAIDKILKNKNKECIPDFKYDRTEKKLEPRKKPKLLNTDEAADYIGIKSGTLSVWMCTKRYPDLKSLKVGRLRRFKQEDLDEFLKSREEDTGNKINKFR